MKLSRTMSARASSGVIAIAMVCGAGGAFAQTVPPGTAATAQGAPQGLEDIVVTARRQKERLQDAPIAITALSAADIERSNITSADSLTKVVPNVSISRTPGYLTGNATFIRGIGTTEVLVNTESPIGTYIDGVYIGRVNAANFQLVDLERVEVLRGPQGTLFGRNTTGGAISYVTRTPDADFGVEQKLTVGSFDQIASRTRINTGELGESGIAATISYLHEQQKGYYRNPYADGDHTIGASNNDAIWAKAQGHWGDFTATYTLDWTDARGTPPVTQIEFLSPLVRSYYANTTGNPFLAQTGPGFKRDYGVAERPQQRGRIVGHALTLEYAASDYLTLKSITGRRTYTGRYSTSFSPPGVFGPTITGIREVGVYANDNARETAKQFSQEFQLLGKAGNFSYVGGLYYFRETGTFYSPSAFTFVISPTLATNLTGLTQLDHSLSRSLAAFAQSSWKPAFADDRLEVTLGVRYTEDKKTIWQSQPAVRNGDKSFSNTSINTNISYKPVDDVMLYARYSTGYRSGGFDVRAPATANFVFKPEKAKAYEVGVKSEFLDRKVRFNAAGYYTDYKNLQVTNFTASTTGASATTASATARFKGFETELQALPIRNLTLNASLGYTDAKYKAIFFPVPATPVPGHTPLPGEVVGGLGNYADISRVKMVPKWTINAGAQYLSDTTGYGQVLARISYNRTSRRYFDINTLQGNFAANVLYDPRSWQIDARLGLLDIPLRNGVTGEVSLHVENLTNRHNILHGIDFGALGFAGRIYGPPREIGADFRLRF